MSVTLIASAAWRPQPSGLGRKRRSFRVRVAVAALERTAIADVHALHGPVGRGDIARARRPYGDPAHVDAGLDAARRHDGPYDVPGAQARRPRWWPWAPCRGSPTRSCDTSARVASGCWMRSGTIPATLREAGVLAPTHAASVQWVLGSSRVVRFHFVRPPGPRLQRQAPGGQPAEERPARRVHRRRVA